MVKLLPLYTERQKEILEEKQKFKSPISRAFKELEFQFEPYLERIIIKILQSFAKQNRKKISKNRSNNETKLSRYKNKSTNKNKTKKNKIKI